jgi:hypothetical protein
MPKNLQRKDRGASTLCVTLASVAAGKTTEAGFYYGFAAAKRKNVTRLSLRLTPGIDMQHLSPSWQPLSSGRQRRNCCPLGEIEYHDTLQMFALG